MKRFLLLALIVSGCSPIKLPTDPRTIYGVNPEFIKYVNSFEKEYGKSIGDVSMDFVDQPSNIVGLCKKWGYTYRQVEVDKTYWKQATEEERMGLVFHELGHCVLDREHKSDYFLYNGLHITGQVPASLMFPYNFYTSFYSELEAYYKYEMFHPQLAKEIVKSSIGEPVETSKVQEKDYTEIIDYK